MTESAGRKILITAPSWIGDMVMGQSLFACLKQNRDVIIDVLAPNWVLGLVERMPEVRRGIAFNSRHGKLDLGMRLATGWSLRRERYHEAIVMPRSLKAAIPSWLAGIPRRTGFSRNLGLINNPCRYRKSREELFVRRLLSLARDDAYEVAWNDIPRPALRVDEEQRSLLLGSLGLTPGAYVTLAPGAEYGPAKQWPMARFAELAMSLEQRGLRPVIIGSAKEATLAEEIQERAGSTAPLNLCGRTRLTEVIDLVSASYGMVVNDSGLMHLGCAAGARVVAIYGSSSSRYTPPLSDSAVILEQQLGCQPCFERQCRFGHYDCLERIGVRDVLECEIFHST